MHHAPLWSIMFCLLHELHFYSDYMTSVASQSAPQDHCHVMLFSYKLNNMQYVYISWSCGIGEFCISISASFVSKIFCSYFRKQSTKFVDFKLITHEMDRSEAMGKSSES